MISKMSKQTRLAIVLFAMVGFASPGYGQAVFNKLKQKAGEAAEKAIDKKLSGKQNNSSTPQNGTSSDSGSESSSDDAGNTNRSNTKGGGLSSTPPDVNQNLSDAEAAYKTKSYGEARYAVQQAMLGVELEIGNSILKSLPESVTGLPKQEEADQVTSNGSGWAGLTIRREYLQDDKELRFTIANNSAWMTAYNMYLTNSGYAQTTGGQQQFKQTKVKGYRGIIEYDESSGYKLSVGLGQSSLLIWEGVNFASEAEMMKAAEAFDIDGIKKQLGEQ